MILLTSSISKCLIMFIFIMLLSRIAIDLIYFIK